LRRTSSSRFSFRGPRIQRRIMLVELQEHDEEQEQED